MKHRKKVLLSESGITLVALVVTIIVMLILASVTIMSAIGNNGLITKVVTAKEETPFIIGIME